MTPFVFPHGFDSQAAIDAAYDPARVVADVAAERAHFATRSAEARRALPGRFGLPFGPTLAESLDIFPAAQPDAPVFVFIHGGYWRASTAQDYSSVALGLQPLGITTVVLNYALCPQVRLDEIVRQVRAGLAWVLRHIGGHGGDPARVAIGGHSAGGHLGAMALLTDWAGDYGLPIDPFTGALLVSGLYDLAPLRYSYLQPLIQLDEALVRQQSPVYRVRPCATPLLLSWGEAEQSAFAQQSQRFHA
ncbi:MAG: alpha/beta hydrolase, partial [Comamonadaceae bacterium]